MDAAAGQTEPQAATARPALVILNDSFWNPLGTPKCRLGGGPEFRAFNHGGFASVQLLRSVAACQDASALLRRHDRAVWVSVGAAVLGGAALALFLGGLLEISQWATPLARWHQAIKHVMAMLLPIALFGIGYSILIGRDAYRCFQKAVKVCNQFVGAAPAQKEQ